MSCTIFLISCSQDESELSPDSPIIGTWDLEMIVYNDFPDGFGLNDGTVMSLRDLRIDNWRYIFDSDGTYFSLSQTEGQNFSRNGQFEYIKNSLTFSSADFTDPENFLFVDAGNMLNDDKLTVYKSVEVLALSNIVLDTLKSDINDQDFHRFAVPVKANIYYFFDRSEFTDQ